MYCTLSSGGRLMLLRFLHGVLKHNYSHCYDGDTIRWRLMFWCLLVCGMETTGGAVRVRYSSWYGITMTMTHCSWKYHSFSVMMEVMTWHIDYYHSTGAGYDFRCRYIVRFHLLVESVHYLLPLLHFNLPAFHGGDSVTVRWWLRCSTMPLLILMESRRAW